MKWLNYHHLYYFWTVARLGTISAACEELDLAQPTISAQLRTLERSIGHKLFQQVGRTLEMTEAGRIAYRYANDIFTLGRELVDTLDGRPVGSRARLRIGVADGLPTTIVAQILQPITSGEAAEGVHLLCYEGKPAELLARLSLHELDVVLSDQPAAADSTVHAYTHQLGECGVSVFGPTDEARDYARGFPQSLDGAPFVLPTENTSLRRMLDHWFERNESRPQVLAEFEDSALLKAFVRVQKALFPAPSAMGDEIADLYGVRPLGELPGLTERFYAISLERRIKHPIVVKLLDWAHDEIFA